MIVNGVVLQPDPTGVLHWAEARLLAVADLHLGKGKAFARHGSLLPPHDTKATIRRLTEAVIRLDPECVVCLGDSFHDREAVCGLEQAALAALEDLARGRDWIWIAGNHDPAPPAMLSGRAMTTFTRGRLTFRHEPSCAMVAGEVSGHLHPSAVIAPKGTRIRRRCFASDGRRVILPAFGAYAGGLDVHERAFSGLFPAGFDVWLVGARKMRRIPGDRLVRPAWVES